LVATLTNAATGKTIINANVVVILDNVKTTFKTDSNGQVKVSTSDLAKNYVATISYAGNVKFNPSSTTVKSVENKTITSLSVVYDKETDEVVATLFNMATGNVIKGAKVVINIDGIKNSFTTDSNGQVKLSTGGLYPNRYTVNCSYAGNAKYGATSTTVNIAVDKFITIISANDTGGELVATLTNDITGKIINGAKLMVAINGIDYTLTTDSKGQIKVSTSDLAEGYTAIISYAGNAKYSPSAATLKSVENKAVTGLSTIYDSENCEVVVTLVNMATGNVIKGAKVVIDLDGVRNSLTSDVNGQVKVSSDG
jgi:hypothetical protein